MPQTLLALLAMILASLISFSQQRNSLATYDAMLDNEIEMAASGAMMHVIELIGGRSFDERSTPESIRAIAVLPGGSATALPSSPTEFNALNRFGSYDRGGSSCNLEEPFRTTDCDDIDDVHGLRGAVVNAHFSDGRTLPFTVDVDVQYVLDSDVQTPSLTQTRHKRVIVTAHNDFLPGGQIVIERVFSYDPIKAEMDYETIHGPLDT